MYVLAVLLALASPAPRPTLPPRTFHIVSAPSAARKACGIYIFEKAVRIINHAILVACKRPKGVRFP